MDRKIAFFVDGGYFISRLRFFHRHYFKNTDLTCEHAINILYKMVNRHKCKENLNRDEMYRIYYYDAPAIDCQQQTG